MTHSISGAARALKISRRTVQRYARKFPHLLQGGMLRLADLLDLRAQVEAMAGGRGRKWRSKPRQARGISARPRGNRRGAAERVQCPVCRRNARARGLRAAKRKPDAGVPSPFAVAMQFALYLRELEKIGLAKLDELGLIMILSQLEPIADFVAAVEARLTAIEAENPLADGPC